MRRIRNQVRVALIALILSTLTIGGIAFSAERELFSLARPTTIAVNSSFLSPLDELFGDIAIGRGVFLSGNTVVRADPGTSICIESETNLQDNILFLALRNLPSPRSTRCGRLGDTGISSSTGEKVSIAHQAKIENSYIGNFTFIGFRAYLNNVVLENGAFVLHGARLTNVKIGKNRLVPIGAIITTQAQADALPLKTDENSEFQTEVLEVNKEFAEHYSELYNNEGFDAIVGVSVAPRTSWNPKPVKPTLGKNVQIAEFVRVVGDVRIGDNSTIGQRTSIRADEGTPIIIGDNAEIEDRVTFHALKGTSIRIGRNLNSDDNIVFHGPLEVGDNLTIGDDAILFRSQVGNNVTIGTQAIVVGVTLRNGVRVPDNAVITTQQQADALRQA
ncbi:carbonate dehydratase [Chroogloeocystis siderophila]|uniref:carbonate dehydratase n=1 Tax=Chroogloeocystis siderophila TaxID=329163 RepID=UPI000A04BD19|nr:carbonate dehydratase [Chroogloeocystis siderophila]